MLTTLLFDVGGVLLSNGWDHAERARAAERFGLDRAELDARHAPLAAPLECGALTLDEYLTQTVFHAPRPFSREAFVAFMQGCSEARPEALALVARLVAGYRLATLNNEGRELNEYRIERFRLHRYFSAFCSSCYLGARKPGEEIYHRALGVLHARPEECGFVDDRAENLDVPRALGLTCFLFTTADQLERDLCLD